MANFHRRSPARWAGVLLIASAIALGGCAEPTSGRVAVTGRVTLDGVPLDNATIVFTPQGQGLAAAALISDGTFEIPASSGPTPGSFHVRIDANAPELEEVEANPARLAARLRRPSVPRIYQREGTLTATIKDEPHQELTFELQSKRD